MKKQRSEVSDKRQDQAAISLGTKIQQFFLSLFTRDEKLLPDVAKAKLVVIYIQLYLVVRIILQHTLLVKTNNPIYGYVSTIISILQLLFLTLPRLSTSHFIFKVLGFVMVGFLCGNAALLCILVVNYLWFQSVCTYLKNYYSKLLETVQICDSVSSIYFCQIVESVIAVIVPVGILFLIAKAYKVSKKAFEEQQTKKRRKDRYNQLLLKKHIYNDKRKT